MHQILVRGAPVAPDRRNSSREGIAVKPFSSSCHFTTTDQGRPCAYVHRGRRSVARARAHTHTHTRNRPPYFDRHKNIGERLDKLPGRKSIGHSRLFGGAREKGPKKETERNGNGEKREALRTGYITDWFRYCSR